MMGCSLGRCCPANPRTPRPRLLLAAGCASGHSPFPTQVPGKGARVSRVIPWEACENGEACDGGRGRGAWGRVAQALCLLHVIRGLGQGWRGAEGQARESQGPRSSGSTLGGPRTLAQDLAELLVAPLHLGDARQLLLEPLLLLSQAQAGG